MGALGLALRVVPALLATALLAALLATLAGLLGLLAGLLPALLTAALLAAALAGLLRLLPRLLARILGIGVVHRIAPVSALVRWINAAGRRNVPKKVLHCRVTPKDANDPYEDTR
jgi:hypothetical protein